MKSGDRSENPVVVALALATVAAVLVGAAAHAASRALANLAYPEVPLTLVAALVIFALPLLIARVLVVRRALRERVRFLLIPTDTFDPPDEAVLRFASALGRVRRPVWGKLDGPASAIRVELDQDTEGQLRYSIELPARARAILRTAVAPYGEVELREMAPDEERRSAGEARSQTARLELSLAHASPEPLRDAGLDPDPLAGFARALSRARPRRRRRRAGLHRPSASHLSASASAAPAPSSPPRPPARGARPIEWLAGRPARPRRKRSRGSGAAL